MKAVIAADSISLRSRKMLFTWGVILRIIIKNFRQLLEMPFTEAVAQKGSFFHSIGGSKRLV